MKRHMTEVKNFIVMPENQTFYEEKSSSQITVIYLDLYKFFNWLTAYGALIRLKSQFFCTLTAHTLKRCNINSSS